MLYERKLGSNRTFQLANLVTTTNATLRLPIQYSIVFVSLLPNWQRIRRTVDIQGIPPGNPRGFWFDFAAWAVVIVRKR